MLVVHDSVESFANLAAVWNSGSYVADSMIEICWNFSRSDSVEISSKLTFLHQAVTLASSTDPRELSDAAAVDEVDSVRPFGLENA